MWLEHASFPKRHIHSSAHNDLLSSQLSARGVAMATDEVPKIQGASVSRTTTFMKFHNVMYCHLYTLQAIGGNDPSLSLVTVHVYVFHLIFFYQTDA